MLSSYILNIISSCWSGWKYYLQIVKYFVSKIIRLKSYENLLEQTFVYLIINLSKIYKNFIFLFTSKFSMKINRFFAFTSMYVPDVTSFASVYHTNMDRLPISHQYKAWYVVQSLVRLGHLDGKMARPSYESIRVKCFSFLKTQRCDF